jgi:uncharacterized protein YbdZ (MbtH family)
MVFTHRAFAEFLSHLEAGELAKEAALNWLETAWQTLESDYAKVVELVGESGYYEQSPEEVDHGLTALGDYQEAVEAAFNYLEEDWHEGLELAKSKAQEGQNKMIIAFEKSRKFEDSQLLDTLS